jgi:hypothetical protein
MRKFAKIMVMSFLIALVMLELCFLLKKESKAILRIDSTTLQIDRFGICRNVINPTTQAVMIPVGSREEWCSFIRNASSLGIILEKCQICERRCRCSNCWTMICNDYNFNQCPAA